MIFLEIKHLLFHLNDLQTYATISQMGQLTQFVSSGKQCFLFVKLVIFLEIKHLLFHLNDLQTYATISQMGHHTQCVLSGKQWYIFLDNQCDKCSFDIFLMLINAGYSDLNHQNVKNW